MEPLIRELRRHGYSGIAVLEEGGRYYAGRVDHLGNLCGLPAEADTPEGAVAALALTVLRKVPDILPRDRAGAEA